MAITFILVEPSRPANVGLACRAMKTMGLNRLRLVNPCSLEDEARWAAHESTDILDEAGIFEDLGSALSDVDFSVATTARQRLEHDDYPTPEALASAIHGKQGSIQHAALVFGRESDGLTGDEIALCHAASTVPLATQQPSLNLAQAVLVYARSLYEASREQQPTESADPGAYSHAREDILSLLHQLDLDDHRRLERWALEGLARFDDRDLGILLTVLRRIEKRLNGE
jgi:tRNA/rRNA methyltransferase